MKGKYEFEVRSKKVVFRFEIKRNITVIKGDSASGKTTSLKKVIILSFHGNLPNMYYLPEIISCL